MTVIHCENLTKKYHSQIILKELNCHIQEDTLTGVIGRNGVGKTTLLRIIGGFVPVTAGKVSVFSHNPLNDVTVASNMIFVDDRMTFPSNLTIQQILRACERFYHGWDGALAQRLLQHFSISLYTKPHLLSKGMKNTLFAVIGIASRSPLTIFDEPTNGMDASVRKDFYRALLKDYVDHPRTILLSSHHLEEIEHLLEDVLLIHDQKVRFHQSINDLQEKYISITGMDAQIAQIIDEIDIVQKQRMGPYTSVTVENTFTEEAIKAMVKTGLQTTNVSANDAYIAMTETSKGGIDDAFTS